MSTAIARNFQIGIDPTPTNNFTLYQPATPDGTLRLGNGNTGITTSLLTLTSAGNLGIGTSSPSGPLQISLASGVPWIDVTGGSYTTRLFTNSASTGLGGLYAVTNNPLAFGTNDTERMRIDTSGNVGIGTASPAQRLEVVGNVDITTVAANGNGLRIRTPNGSGSPAIIQFTNNPVTSQWGFITSPAAGVLTFGNATEYARFDSGGNLLVGTTTPNGGVNNKIGIVNTGQIDYGITIRNSNASFNDAIAFFNNSGTRVGVISFTTTATSYVTSSDYRLKHDITPMTGALAKVAALKPCTYKWKVDGSDGEGFIAHELAEVVPQCVTGEKDAVDADGKPVYQGIDTSFLVATLTAAIQELKAEFDAYKATHP